LDLGTTIATYDQLTKTRIDVAIEIEICFPFSKRFENTRTGSDELCFLYR